MARTPLEDATIDFEAKRERHRRWFYANQPKTLRNVLGQLITKRGYGQLQANEQLERAWSEVVGAPLCEMSRACRVYRGKVEVVVANSVAQQELTFRKDQLVDALRERLPGSRINGIRLRVGRLP